MMLLWLGCWGAWAPFIFRGLDHSLLDMPGRLGWSATRSRYGTILVLVPYSARVSITREQESLRVCAVLTVLLLLHRAPHG